MKLGDRLNPILVKETRQALKSRQFIVTFSLLLIAAWVWTIFNVARIGPDIWYGAYGRETFIGYFAILAFCLLVIVPFGAMRSLAAEHEEKTYELLSITVLGPRQIIRGKLGSAALQMIIYLSVIAPCLAFTYLLRGIDLPTILFLIGLAVLGSVGLAIAGLLVGTLATEKHWQAVLAVLAVWGLLSGFGGACSIAAEILSRGSERTFAEPLFWSIVVALLTGYLSYCLLVFYAAAARITFTSDNRSTRLRIVMVAQQVLLVGWLVWFWGREGWRAEDDFPLAFLVASGLHWYAMGALMTGESPELSARVKRRLPQSLLGRAFLTWFNPGPGTGYLLAISGLAAMLLLTVLATTIAPDFVQWIIAHGPARAGQQAGPLVSRWGTAEANRFVAVGAVGLSYLVIYLGLGLLLLRLLRRVSRVGVMTAAIIHVLLLLAGSFVPLVVQEMLPGVRNTGYTMLQISNAPWTLAYLLRSPRALSGALLPPETPLLMVILPLAAIVVFLLNLPGVVGEIRQVRIARPLRVAEEDAQLAAQKSPPKPVRRSPWD